MRSQDSQELAHQAEWLYEHSLKAVLEQSHPEAFVAIEPVSGEYFVGVTLSEAIGAARKAHPQRIAYAMRVGRRAAVHLGACQQ